MLSDRLDRMRLIAHWPQNGLICVYLWLTFRVVSLTAQNAEISGLITDSSGLAVPYPRVVVQSSDTRKPDLECGA
jgi:hypothetical protein